MRKVKMLGGSPAMIGFKNYEEAEKFAEDNDGIVARLRTRSGSGYYEQLGDKNELFDYFEYAEDLGLEHECYENNEQERLLDSIKNYLEDDLTNLDEMEGIENFVELAKKSQKITEEFATLTNGQVMILNGLEIFEVVPEKMMSYSEDVWTYHVGVILED